MRRLHDVIADLFPGICGDDHDLTLQNHGAHTYSHSADLESDQDAWHQLHIGSRQRFCKGTAFLVGSQRQELGNFLDDSCGPSPRQSLRRWKATSFKVQYDQQQLGGFPFTDAIKNRNIPKPCDKMGRLIVGSKDAHFCKEDYACVTAMPHDFSKALPQGDPFCWGTSDHQWAEKLATGTNEHNVPMGEWHDMCEKLAGQPWCVPEKYVEKYPGPIEVRCSASGPAVKSFGSPTGCWLHELVFKGRLGEGRDDLQRLPGPIYTEDQKFSGQGWYVSHHDAAKYNIPTIKEKAAEKWILEGDLTPEKTEPVKGAGEAFLKVE